MADTLSKTLPWVLWFSPQGTCQCYMYGMVKSKWYLGTVPIDHLPFETFVNTWSIWSMGHFHP